MKIRIIAGFIWIVFLPGLVSDTLETCFSTVIAASQINAGKIDLFLPRGYRFLLRLETPLTTDGLRSDSECNLYLAHDLFLDLRGRVRVPSGIRVKGSVVETRRRKPVMRPPRIRIGNLCMVASSKNCVPLPAHSVRKYYGSRLVGSDLILPVGTWLEVELLEEWKIEDTKGLLDEWDPPDAAVPSRELSEVEVRLPETAGSKPDLNRVRIKVQPEEVRNPDTPHFVARVDRVGLEVVVKDRKGRIIGDLTREDFRVLEDGVEREIAEFSWQQRPLSAAILVDQSGSIDPYKKQLRTATLTALNGFTERDRFALFFFNEKVRRVVDLTSDRQVVADHIEQLRSSGQTNMFDPILCAAHYLYQVAPELEHALIVISDNMANSIGRSGEGCALRMALETGTVVYSLRLPSSEPAPLPAEATPLWIGDLDCIRRIVTETGGEVIELGEERDLSLALQQIVQRLRLRYSLAIIPGQRQDDGFRTLRVELSPRFGEPNRDYFVAARRGYYYRTASE